MENNSQEQNNDINVNWINKLRIGIKLTRLYHRHEVLHLDLLPQSGAFLLISNHSFATYDFPLLFDAIFDHTKRIVRPLIDRLFFKVPFAGPIYEALGAKEGSHENAKKLLGEGRIVAIAPGGMNEALRPSTKKYRIYWKERIGFIKLAFHSQVPIVLSACPRADDLYDIIPNPFTEIIYKKLKIPFVFARGIGMTIIPKPVKLVHVLSAAFHPPVPDSDVSLHGQQIKAFHAFIVARMEELMKEAKEISDKL